MNRRVRLTEGLGGIARSEKVAELLNREPGIADNAAKGKGVHRVVPRNGQDAATVRHDGVLTLAYDHKPRLLESTDSVEMIDARNLRQGYAEISISRTFSPRNCSSTTLKYSRMASLMFSTASVSDAPCDQQPGRPGTETE